MAAETRSTLGFGLTFVDGRAVLGAGPRPLSALGRADQLEMEIPNLRFPFDLSGGVARFQNRRCRLRELSVSVAAADVAAFLRGGRLADFGLHDPRVNVTGGGLRVEGRARLGPHEAGFTARAAVRPQPPRRARVTLYDVRVYGFMPVSAPMLASALFAPCGPLPQGPPDAAGPTPAPLLWLEGATDLGLELLDLALLGLLPAQGWRMPERDRVRLGPVREAEGRLVLCFEPANGESATGALDDYDESRRRHAAAETALARGEIGAALDGYRRAGAVSAGDQFAATRLLQLLAAGASTLPEAEAQAALALDCWPDFVPALLARAVAAGESGRPDEAAAIYERLAAVAEQEGSTADQASALVAAGRERQRAGDAAAAFALVECAVAVAPGHGGASRALGQRLAAEARWADLLRVVIQRAVDEVDAPAKAAAYAEAGFIYLDRFSDAAHARDRFDQAVRLAPGEPAGWEGLGSLPAPADPATAVAALERALQTFEARGDGPGQARVKMALAARAETAGDEAAALRLLEEAAAADEEAPEPLRRAGEMAVRRADFAEAGRLFQGLLARAMDPEQRAAVVRRLADVLGGPLGEPVPARMLLEQALAHHPCDTGLLDEIRALLGREGARGEWEPFLRRALERAQRPDERRAALTRLCDLYRERGDSDRLAEMLGRLLDAGGAEGAAAGVELAALVQSAAEPALMARAADALRALLEGADPVPDDSSPARRAELSWRLASLLGQRGDEDGALHWLRQCLEGEAAGDVAVAAWRRFVEIAARRGDASAAGRGLVAWAEDPRTGEGERERARHLVAAAEIFRERLGMVADAVALLERAFGLDPLNDGAFATLDALATQTGDWPRLAEAIGRRAEVARPAEQKTLWARLGAVLAGPLARPADAVAVYARLLEADPGHPAALLFCARDLWSAGERARSAEHYGRLADQELPAADAAEVHLRLAVWAGAGEEAEHHLARAVAGEPEAGAAMPVLVEALEELGRGDELAHVLERREAAADGPARAELARARAVALERLGREAEALAVYRTLASDPREEAVVLARMAELLRREGREDDLVPVLDRLWELACDGPASSSIEALGLELAQALARQPGQAGRAEGVLRVLVERAPDAAAPLEALSALLAARGADDESDALLVRRSALPGDAPAVARLLAARAERREPRPALALLRAAAPWALEPEALRRRLLLVEEQGDLGDALVCGRALASRAAGDRDVILDLARLARRPEVLAEVAWALLEELLAAAPAEEALGEALDEVLPRLADATPAAALLGRGLPLAEATAARLHRALGEEAARAGEWAQAVERLEQALALDSPADERARQLVAHARVLLQRRELEDALVDLAEALALVPDHAPALALRGELAYRNQDWEEARRSYDRLLLAPGAAQMIAPELLSFRRAVLAETFGDEAEAETAYLEVARLAPAHVEAREALAQIAFFHDRLPEAARWLEEVLSLLPPGAREKTRETRQRLAEVYVSLHDFAAARQHLELVLASEPDRERALESLVAVYEKLGLAREAATACERLARVYEAPEQRARALFQQGEILREKLGDAEAASDAYLRSSDLDPGFAPTLRRLIPYYWSRGDFSNLADVGAELAGKDGADSPELGVLIALGAAAAGRGSVLAACARGADAALVAQRLSELGTALRERGPTALDPALDALAEAGAGPSIQALVDRAAATLDPGALVALARLGGRQGDVALARVAHELLSVADPDHPPPAPGPGARAEAFAPGAVDHPLGQGPVRRALRGLARPLAGFGRIAGRSRVAGLGPPAEAVARLEEVRARLDGPSFRAVLQTEVEGAVALATRPITIAVGPTAAALPDAELSFLAGRAFEEARSGELVARALGPDLPEMLQAVLTAVGGVPAVGELAAWMTDPETAALLPKGTGLAQLLSDLDQAGAELYDIDALLRGCHFTAGRVGLLVCGSAAAAVRALAAADASEERRELVAFALSAEYRALLA